MNYNKPITKKYDLTKMSSQKKMALQRKKWLRKEKMASQRKMASERKNGFAKKKWSFFKSLFSTLYQYTKIARHMFLQIISVSYIYILYHTFFWYPNIVGI